MHQWGHGFGDTSFDSGQAVAADASGNVTVAGWFRGTVDFGGGPLFGMGPFTIFIAQYDANGVHQCSRNPGSGIGHAVAVDVGDDDSDSNDDGGDNQTHNVVATGEFRGTADFGGGPLMSAGDTDIFVVKYGGSARDDDDDSDSEDKDDRRKFVFGQSSLGGRAVPFVLISRTLAGKRGGHPK